MSISTVRHALDELVTCEGCGTDFVPWRAGQRCPLCTRPAPADPLHEAMGSRTRAVQQAVEIWWRLGLLAVAWVVVLTTVVVVWRAG